jgi:Transglycosylase SLT domain
MTSRTALLGSAAVAVLAAPLLLVGLLLTITTTTMSPGSAPAAINVAALPPLARELLPDLQDLLARECPQLPLAWALAIPQVESSWNPAAYNATGHAAGLYQLTQPAWTAAGGTAWPTTPPPSDAPVFQPEPHLQRAIPFLCGNLHTVTTNLAATGKPVSPLDALLVCHVAGCRRVLDSPTGIPRPGDAGCDNACAATVHSYIASVHAVLDRITQPGEPVAIGDLPYPAPYAGPAGAGCTEPDPSGHGCLTPAMRHALEQALTAFGPAGPDQTIRAVSCWDPHTWNPTSDHPHGRACDLFPTRAGTFPAGTDLANGWHIATWLRAHAAALHINYLIWQDRYWSPTTPDTPGNWGIPYDGGGIYNIHDPTGGHYDHIHASVASL